MFLFVRSWIVTQLLAQIINSNPVVTSPYLWESAAIDSNKVIDPGSPFDDVISRRSPSSLFINNIIDRRSSIPTKRQTLIHALNTLGTDVTEKSDSFTSPSLSSDQVSATSVRNVGVVGIVRSNVTTNKGKYGTTRHLKQLFLGRCYEYQYRKNSPEESEWDCNALWELFFNAFAYKGACDVTSQDYEKFLDAIDENVEEDKGLLWSGTRELSHKLSDFAYTNKFTTLEDTAAGYLLSGLTWCGHPNRGLNFKECPWACSLQSPYWSLANTRFAEKLRGVVHLVLNGTRMHLNDGRKYPTYMKDRYYLGPNVVPILKHENIAKIIMIVAHTLHLEPLEHCGEESVKVLEEELKKKGISVECHDDPKSSRYVFCSSDPDAKECAGLLTTTTTKTTKTTTKNNDADNTDVRQPLSSSAQLLSPPARL